MGKMQIILEEIEKVSEVNETAVKEELAKRVISNFIENMIK